ncbi:MAG: hypothetical protein OXF76_19905 [Caldilineaceae bacterium]|nr:hypothetical protein [Caldilineaceae bacterium]
MTVVAVLGTGIYNVMTVIGLLGWPGSSRLGRGQSLSMREWNFVMVTRCLRGEDRRIMFRHILLNVLAPLLVAATLGVASAMLTEVGLTFLGLGVLPPGIAILFSVLAISFVGDGLRDAFDPRMTLD